jgi:hypothetical protein
MIVFGWVVCEQSKVKDAGSQQLVAVVSKVIIKSIALTSTIFSTQRKKGDREEKVS